jgi:hypothetical protein
MDPLLGQSDMFFVTKYSQILSRQGGRGGVCDNLLAKKGTYGLAVGRECWSWRRTAGKQHQGTALASIRQPCESLMEARLKAMHDRGGSQPEERHGHAAKVLMIIRRRKNPVHGGFGKIFAYPPPFEERRLDPCALSTPPLVGTQL